MYVSKLKKSSTEQTSAQENTSYYKQVITCNDKEVVELGFELWNLGKDIKYVIVGLTISGAAAVKHTDHEEDEHIEVTVAVYSNVTDSTVSGTSAETWGHQNDLSSDMQVSTDAQARLKVLAQQVANDIFLKYSTLES